MQIPVVARHRHLVLLAVVLLSPTGLAGQPGSGVIEGVPVPANGVGDRWGWYLLHSACSPGYKPNYTHCLFTVPAATPNAVWSVALRGYNDLVPHPVFPAFSVDVEIGAGHSRRPPSNPSYDLAANRGPDFQIVLQRRTVHFPAMSGPRPLYRFPFDRPFTFRPGETGIVELRVFGSTLCIGDPRAQDMTFERYGIPRSAPGSEFGRACSTDFGGTGNRLHAGPMSVGNPGDAHLSGTVGLEGRARLFGGLRKDAWNGLPLPFALDAWGAPGCTLHSSLEWEWPAYWYDFPSAFKFFSLDLPNDPTVIGQRVYLQGVIPTRQNALGFETSNGCEVTVGPHIDPPLSVVHTPSANGGLEGGQRHVGHGPVLELRGR